MDPSERRWVVAVSAAIIFVNLSDLMTTYAASPDLAHEWNALVRHLGMGWAALWVAKAVGVGLAVAGYVYYVKWRRWCYPDPGTPLVTFCHDLTYGPSDVRHDLPMRLRRLGVNLGFFWAGMQALVLWVAADNLLLRWGHVWEVRQFSELGYHMAQSGVVAAFVLLRFYTANYREYRRLTAGAPIRA